MSSYLLDLSDNFKLRGCLAFSSEQLLQVAGDVPPSNVRAHDGMTQGEALVDWHRMSDPITQVQHDTCGTPSGISGGREGEEGIVNAEGHT